MACALPSIIMMHHGTEFTGCDFQCILMVNGIKDVATSNKNPQANAVCGCMHQTITNILCPLLHTHVPQNDQAANDVINTALATASYASCGQQSIAP